MRLGQIVALPDGYFDPFDRQRVSDPVTLFDYQPQYNTGAIFWQTVLAGGGTETHLPAETAVSLAVTTAGDSVVRQTRQYMRYQPGKGHEILMTGVFGAAATGVVRRCHGAE